MADPGFDTDLCVTTDVRAFTQVFLGHVSIVHALGDGSVSVAGRSDLRRLRWVDRPEPVRQPADLAKFTF
jgi:hypothetical protein